MATRRNDGVLAQSIAILGQIQLARTAARRRAAARMCLAGLLLAAHGSAVRMPAGPALSLIDPAGLSSLPSKLNTMISFSTMHWTKSVRLPLLQATPL